MGLPVSSAAWEINDRTGYALHEKAGAAGAEISSMMAGKAGNKDHESSRRGLWDRTDNLIHNVPPSSSCNGTANGYNPHQLPPQDLTNIYGLDITRIPECLRINIPTVHIYGIKDPRYTSSMQLAHFCAADKRRVLDHGGGHEVPRTTRVSNEIAEAIMWLETMI